MRKATREGGVDENLFIKQFESGIIIAQIYVDEIMFASTSDSKVQEFVYQMKQEFEMSVVGKLTYFLGLQVKQHENGIFISQSKYAKNLVKKFGLEIAKHFKTPMSTTLNLSKDENCLSVDPTLNRSMIGSLLYLIASRPFISYNVGVSARYQVDLKESHIATVTTIIYYINGTLEFGFWYSHDTNVTLVGFSNADWAANVNDRNSTSGGCFYLRNNLVSWHSKKQNSISLSTTKVEYISLGSYCTQLL